MAGNDSGRPWDPSVMAPSLTPSEKRLRDKFVEEYLKDHDPVSACVRMGLMMRVAISTSVIYMQCPYVLSSIRNVQAAKKKRGEEIFTNDMLEAKLWEEANYRGPGSSHSSRVTALSKLANMRGMDGATKIKAEVTHRGGVMVVPAMASSIEEWEQEAVTQQAQLMSEARH